VAGTFICTRQIHGVSKSAIFNSQFDTHRSGAIRKEMKMNAKTIPANVAAAVQRAAANAPRGAGDLSGPFKLSALALKAGTPEALNLREGSARYKLMKYVYANAPKRQDGFTREELTKVLKEQTGQALAGMVAYKFLTRCR
jgi:hypothetical protein